MPVVWTSSFFLLDETSNRVGKSFLQRLASGACDLVQSLNQMTGHAVRNQAQFSLLHC